MTNVKSQMTEMSMINEQKVIVFEIHVNLITFYMDLLS